MKKIFLIMFVAFWGLGLTGCSNDKNVETTTEAASEPWAFGEKKAIIEDDSGWYYVFTYTYKKEGFDLEELVPYNFFAVNLRYRYNDDYTTIGTITENGEVKEITVPLPIQILGLSNSEKIHNDMLEIASILKYSGGEVTNEDLLKLTKEDLSFEELDEDIFLNLISTALNGEPHKEGDYLDLPNYALLSEQEYLSGYKFQIGFLTSIGCIDKIFIDVLYRTGDEYNDYVQLSDMVDSGTATDEQLKIYNLIAELSKGIVNENNLLYMKNELENAGIEGVDMSRLGLFLENIHNGEYDQYIVN